MLKKEQVLKILKPISVSLIPYVLFYLPILSKNTYLGGSDPTKYFYPSRYYLWESLVNGRFPFWTERIYSGFPIYADSERVFLHPLNILVTVLMGPFDSYKFLHLMFYTLGSTALYIFLRRRGFSYLGIFAANLIYYFSFYHLFHQQHFNFTLTTFSIPLGILLADNFARTKKIKWFYLINFLVVLFLYFGSFQSVLILVIAILFYLVTNIPEIINRIIGLKLMFLSGLLILTFSLPLLVPTFQLYLKANRSTFGLDFTQGSYHPLMIVNVIYPYFFGNGSNYKWNMVSSEYGIHETYVYVGVVALVCGFLGLKSLKKQRFRNFLLLNISAFLILGIIKFIPFYNNIPIPLISMFRYWGRSIVLFDFALACLAGYFVSYPSKSIEMLKFKQFELIKIKHPLVLPVGLLIILTLLNSRTLLIMKLFVMRAFVPDRSFFVWLTLLALTLVTITSCKTSLKKDLLSYSLVILIFVDLFYFGNGIIRSYTRTLNEIMPNPPNISTENFTGRTVVVNDNFFWNGNLYYPMWGVYGYSQYVTTNYIKTLNREEIHNDEMFLQSDDPLSYQNLGVHQFIGNDMEFVYKAAPKPLLNEFDGEVLYREEKEGHMNYYISSNKVQDLNTYITNYPGWRLRVNGQRSDIESKDTGQFIKFEVPKGQVVIELKFIPTIFYYSIATSLILAYLTNFFIKKYHLGYNENLL